jgi:hypothetical protein
MLLRGSRRRLRRHHLLRFDTVPLPAERFEHQNRSEGALNGQARLVLPTIRRRNRSSKIPVQQNWLAPRRAPGPEGPRTRRERHGGPSWAIESPRQIRFHGFLNRYFLPVPASSRGMPAPIRRFVVQNRTRTSARLCSRGPPWLDVVVVLRSRYWTRESGCWGVLQMAPPHLDGDTLESR